MLWNKNYYAITVIIQHTADTVAWTTVAITAQNVHVISAKSKKNQTAYEST